MLEKQFLHLPSRRAKTAKVFSFRSKASSYPIEKGKGE